MEETNGLRKVEVETAKGGETNKKELGPQASANANEKASKDSPKKHQHVNHNQNKQRHRSDSGKQNGSNATNADQRRSNYNRDNKQYRSFDQNRRKNPSHNFPAGGKPRSGSTAQVVAQGSVDSKKDEKHEDKKRNQSTNSSGRRSRASNTSMNSNNGESFDYGEDFDLDEPFSDSDDETSRHREVHKPSLQIPRGRIRTLSGTVPPVGYSPKWGGPTMCLSCLEFFDLPDQIDRFTEHLLKEHHIVVEEMELIVDPKRYVEYWRQRFSKESVDKIFPKIVPDEANQYHGKTEYYFELSERIPEDYSLRQRLAMRRLEEALACQQREREEATFSMQCIFCRYVARGNRSKIIHHLYMIHHLNLGSPDNLVFVHEYIDHLKEKLNRNECIYCEKTFTDRNILMDHMRKRNHREVNPKNNYYDKFYIINYLELG
uniref:C2H2-type domain-containing protein n=1 Tax=Acrobeloides nanus TaxID=290746 RepID=A0A914CNH5_9BILA